MDRHYGLNLLTKNIIKQVRKTYSKCLKKANGMISISVPETGQHIHTDILPCNWQQGVLPAQMNIAKSFCNAEWHPKWARKCSYEIREQNMWPWPHCGSEPTTHWTSSKSNRGSFLKRFAVQPWITRWMMEPNTQVWTPTHPANISILEMLNTEILQIS